MAVLAAPKPAAAPAAKGAGRAAPKRGQAKPRPAAKPLLQAKLTVNDPNDRFEREADAIADRVMSMPEGQTRGSLNGRGGEGGARLQRQEEEEAQTFSLQRQEEDEEAQAFSLQRQEEEEEAQTFSLQRQEEEEEAQAWSLQRQNEEEEEAQAKGRSHGRPRLTRSFETKFNAAKAGGGRPLDAPLRSFMEGRFGRDLSDVRVHTGPGPAALAKEANARAFTVGRHLVFGSGEYRPNADQGRRLIAHELTHVFQQRGGLHSVQREIFSPDCEQPARNEDRLLAELGKILGLGDPVLPQAVQAVVSELLRSAVHGPEAALLEAMTAAEATSDAVSRVIEATDYTLSISVVRTARAAKGEWTLGRVGEVRPFFGHTTTTATDTDAPAPGADDARLRLASPMPPRYAADPLIGGSDAPEAAIEIPSAPPPAPTAEPSPPESAKLIEADAVAGVTTTESQPEGRGDNAGSDAPADARPPIDVQAEDDVPEDEPPAEEVRAQRKAVPGAPIQASPAAQAQVSAALAAPGSPLAAELRGSMEASLGADLSGVRLHHDDGAARAAASLGADAFTVGRQVVFGENRFQPGQESGRRLLAHELAHVVQQRDRRSPGALIQRHGGEDCPPPEPVPEIEVVPSPAGPNEDPAFSQMENRTENRAENQAAHGEGDDKSAAANAAAEVKEGEKQSHAQKDQVGEMSAKADNPPAFDKAAFIQAVLAEVEKISPETLDDVIKFAERGKAGQMKGAVKGQVDASAEATQGPLEESASADPGPGESPRAATELDIEPPGPQPGSIRADRAMPPPKTDSEMDLRADTVRADNILKEACVTREFMEKHPDPELKEGIAAQDELHTVTEQAPESFREGEAGELQNARAGASVEGAQGVADMFGARSGQFGEVGSTQTQTKTDNELKRDAAANEINTIFTDTQTKVQDRLKKLDTDVGDTFDRETQAATDKFERFIRTNAEKYKKSWFDSAVEFLADKLFDVPPAEVRDFYREGRVTFLNDMELVVGNVADLVEKGLNDARDIVAEGKTKVQEKLDSLGDDLADFKEQMSEQMNDKFRQLEGDIDAKQGEIVKGLAQRYVKAFEKVKALENQVRDEYKNAFDRAKEALEAAVDFVVGWIEKLSAVVGDTATRIIKDPGAFLSNLGQGIIQGLQMFIGDIGNNIKAAVVEWITGNMSGGGIQLPQTFDVKGIVGFLLDLVGLGVAGIKEIARKTLGAQVVSLIEKGVEGFETIKQIFDILATEGPAGLFRYLQGEFAKMKDQVMGEAGKAIAEGLVVAGIKRVLGIISGLVSGGVGTIVTIVVTIIDVILWFASNAAQIAQLVGTIASMANAVLMGQVGALANAVNGVLKRILPLVLGFVGALVGIGGVVKKIQNIFKAIGNPARNAITKLFLKFKGLVKKLLKKVGLGKGKKKGKQLLDSKTVVRKVLAEMKRPTKAKTPTSAIAEKKAQSQSLISKWQPKLKKGRLKIVILDKTPADVEKDSNVDFTVSASPPVKASALVPLTPDDENAVERRLSRARTLKQFTSPSGFTKSDWGGMFKGLSDSTYQKDLSFGVRSNALEKKGGKYHFKAAVPRAEIVERGATEIQNGSSGHADFQGRFGIPLMQSFLAGRQIAGVPPDSFGNRGIVTEVAARAESAGAIKKIGRTHTWALPKIRPKRTLPAGWGGASHIRPKLYEAGAGFPTLANKLFETVVSREISVLIQKQVDNYDNVKTTGSAIDMSPWATLKAKKLAGAAEKFSIETARASLKSPKTGYFERSRYDVDHEPPLAQHWNAIGKKDVSAERIAATQGKGTGSKPLSVMERGENRSKGSGGVKYHLWVELGFKGNSGDDYHIETGVPFKEYE